MVWEPDVFPYLTPSFDRDSVLKHYLVDTCLQHRQFSTCGVVLTLCYAPCVAYVAIWCRNSESEFKLRNSVELHFRKWIKKILSEEVSFQTGWFLWRLVRWSVSNWRERTSSWVRKPWMRAVRLRRPPGPAQGRSRARARSAWCWVLPLPSRHQSCCCNTICSLKTGSGRKNCHPDYVTEIGNCADDQGQ